MPAAKPDPLREDQAIAALAAAHPDTRLRHWWGQRTRDGWFLTFAPGTYAGPDEPSWLVLDDGRIGSVRRTDTFAAAMRRLRSVRVCD